MRFYGAKTKVCISKTAFRFIAGCRDDPAGIWNYDPTEVFDKSPNPGSDTMFVLIADS
jgi:hypothetical protein